MEDKENNVLATGHYVLFEAKKIPYGERLKIRENEWYFELLSCVSFLKTGAIYEEGSACY
jgi:hypothetical protein